MKTFEDYLEEKFIEENPEHNIKGFQYEGYYENWVMNLDRAKLIELAEEAIKKEREEKFSEKSPYELNNLKDA